MAYPATLDNLPTNADPVGSQAGHAAKHNAEADAINRVEATLGINPQGTYASVQARLAALAASVAAAQAAVPITLFDAAGDLIVGTGADTAAKLPRGAAGQILTSDGTKLVWSTPTGGAGPPPPTLPPYPTAISADTPVGWWRFGEAAGATQAVAQDGPTGTYAAVVAGVTGALIGDADTAVRFNGTIGSGGSGVAMGNFFAFAGSLAYSAEAWVFPTTLDGTARRIFSKFDTGGIGWGVSADSSTVKFTRADQAGVADVVQSGSPLQLNVWSHVVATYDGAAMRLYINGLLVGTTPSTRQAATTTSPFRVGNASTNETLTFAGSIDEPAVYDKAISLAQVQNHFAAAGYLVQQNYPGAVLADGPIQYLRFGELTGTAAADSAAGALHPGVYTGGFTLGVNGANTDGNKAVTFNGTSGYIDSTNPVDLDALSNWTVEMWIYITAAPASDQYLFGSANGAWVAYGLKINSSRQLVLGKINVADGTPSTIVVPTNAWTHVAVGYDKTTRVGYYTINGQAAGGTGVLSATAITAGATLNRIGQTGGGQFFAGTLDEFAVYSASLSTAQEKAHYDAGGGGSAPGSVAPPVGSLSWIGDFETGNWSQFPDRQSAVELGDPDSGGVGRGTMSVVGTDAGIAPASGSFQSKVVLHAYTAKMAAEYLHPRNFQQMIAGAPEFYGFGWYFPTSGNWGTNWEPGTGYQSGSTLCQLAFSGLFGGSIQLKILDSSAFGEAVPFVVCRIAGGYSPAYGTIDFQNALAPGAPVNWTTHQNNQAAWDLGALPQVAGPHTFLAGSHPLTLDAWNYFILEVKWATLFNTGGYVQVWHKLKGGATWTKTYRCDITNAASDQNAQWGRGITSAGMIGSSPAIVNNKYGSYVNAAASALTLYQDNFYTGTTFEAVAAQLA